MTAQQAAALSPAGAAGLHEGWRAFLYSQPKDLLFVTVEISDEGLWTVASAAEREVLHEDGWEPLEDEVLQ